MKNQTSLTLRGGRMKICRKIRILICRLVPVPEIALENI